METLQTLPATSHQEDQTKEIVTRMINLVMVQQIYRTTKLNQDKPLTELIILISDKCSKTLIELVPILDMVFEDYPDYCYRLYHVHQAKDSIKKGNLFFYQVCVAENLCFSDPIAELNLFSQMQGLEKVMDKAKKAFNAEMAKIQAFNDGAGFYWEKENYALTAFMVHQQIELAYRAIELFAMGKDKVTHAIRVHQKHVRPYLPDLGALFDESDDYENKLMQHLDDAYLKVRYGEGYQINKEKLLKAMKKGEEIQQKVTEIYEKMIGEFEQKLLSKQADPVMEVFEDAAVENITAKENEVTEIAKNKFLLNHYDLDIINIITKHLAVECVYCINYKSSSSVLQGIFQKDALEQSSRHFLLLVITKESVDTATLNIQNIINQSKNISATVTLLVHSLKNVNEALLDNNRFFHETLRSGQLVYQKGPVLDLIGLPEYDSIKGLSWATFTWQQRKQRAEALLEAAANMGKYETEVVEIALLNQAMEQLCLGFIFVRIGYKPNQQSLKHLVNICRCIAPTFGEAFPIDTEDDEEVFDTLIDSIKNIRYRIPYAIDPTDVGLLHRRCGTWMEKVEELVKDCIE